MSANEDGYCRQMGALGAEAMAKVAQLKVLISGLPSCGSEAARNLALSGVKAISLHDDGVVQSRDVAGNCLLREADVGKRSRAEACCERLKSINPDVAIDVAAGTLSKDEVGKHSLLLLANASEADILTWNSFCRSWTPSPIGFVAINSLGLIGRIFVDFGDSFKCLDPDDEEPRLAIVAAVTQEKAGTVQTHNERRHGLQDGDWVVFSEVEGMTELNDDNPRQVKVTGPHSFTIEDTTRYGAYKTGGLVKQVKMPQDLRFSPWPAVLESLTNSSASASSTECLVESDSSQRRQPRLHRAAQTVLDQQRLQPESNGGGATSSTASVSAPGGAFVESCVSAAKAKGYDIREDDVRKIALFCRCELLPLGVCLGALGAQEVLKFVGKYRPLHQMMYIDMLDLVPTPSASSSSSSSSAAPRQSDLVAIFGTSVVQRIQDLRLLLFGSGPLACEVLKNLALLGAASDEGKKRDGRGRLFIADDALVKPMHLPQRWLTRSVGLGATSTDAVAAALKAMCPKMQVQAIPKGASRSEDVLNEPEWQQLDCVFSAVDNMEARSAIDSRCIWFEKPLLEAGLSGAKASCQAVIPHLTQSFGESQDLPEEHTSIPLCSLNNFPYLVEHGIEWSRTLFEQLFQEPALEAQSFLKDPSAYLQKAKAEGSSPLQLSRLVGLKRCISPSRSFESCVQMALEVFQDRFDNSIRQLLHNFPVDHKSQDGISFWSSPKRAPSPLTFSPAEELHLNFVIACANLFATLIGAPLCLDEAEVKSIAADAAKALKPFSPKHVNIKVDDKDSTEEGGADNEVELQALLDELSSLASKAKLPAPQALRLDVEGSPSTPALFLIAASNLRCRNYRIEEASAEKIRLQAGRITPALPTTASMAGGLVIAELLKLVISSPNLGGGPKDKVVTPSDAWQASRFSNHYLNLSSPLQLVSATPLPPTKTSSKDMDPIMMAPVRAQPEGFTCWDKVKVSIGDVTMKQLLKFLQEEHEMEVSIVSSGTACLYNAFVPLHKTKLQEKVTKIYEDVTKHSLQPDTTSFPLEVSATSLDDDTELVVPPIRFEFAPARTPSPGANESTARSGNEASPTHSWRCCRRSRH